LSRAFFWRPSSLEDASLSPETFCLPLSLVVASFSPHCVRGAPLVVRSDGTVSRDPQTRISGIKTRTTEFRQCGGLRKAAARTPTPFDIERDGAAFAKAAVSMQMRSVLRTGALQASKIRNVDGFFRSSDPNHHRALTRQRRHGTNAFQVQAPIRSTEAGDRLTSSRRTAVG